MFPTNGVQHFRSRGLRLRNITKLIKLKYVKKRWNQSKEEASVIGNAL